MSVETPNHEQEEFWSRQGGLTWSQNDHILDATLAPVLDHLLDHAGLQPGEDVLDIGCGTGLSTIRAAKAVGPEGQATGADIADQMLVRARQQAAQHGTDNLEFLCADAQTHAFSSNAFDTVISRFGVMFFADPAAAFANIAASVKPGGRMVFMTWASLAKNPWFSVPRAVALDRLGAIEPTPPNAPGPLGLADQAYTAGVFRRAGLDDVTITPVPVDLTPPGTAQDVGTFSLSLGPATRIMMEKNGTEEDGAAIAAAVAHEFSAYDTDHGLRIPAVLNRIVVQLP
jgi:ubiquinone/menaquinone biosynthesis C-methylase UbiE